MIKNITNDILPRIMDQNMILDTFPHPTRSAITALRSFFGIAILAGSCTIPFASPLFAAELFSYEPPSPSQQRSVQQQPAARPQLSSEDKAEIGTFNHSWHIGNGTFAKDLCETLKGDSTGPSFLQE